LTQIGYLNRNLACTVADPIDIDTEFAHHTQQNVCHWRIYRTSHMAISSKCSICLACKKLEPSRVTTENR
jgi:hypothetical protein